MTSEMANNSDFQISQDREKIMSEISELKDARGYLAKCVKSGSSRRVACERELVTKALGAAAKDILETSRGNSKKHCDVSRKVLAKALEGGPASL